MLAIRVAAGTRRHVSLQALIRKASGSSPLLPCYQTPSPPPPHHHPSPLPGRTSFTPLTGHVRHASGGGAGSADGAGGAGAGVDAVSAGWYGAIADSNVVHLTEQLLISSHAATGLPWWATIMCTTLAVRTAVTLPLGAYQMVIIGKVRRVPRYTTTTLLNIVICSCGLNWCAGNWGCACEV